MTPNHSRRHHSPKGNRWCVDDELLALVLQNNSLPTTPQDDLSGKQVGEGKRDVDMEIFVVVPIGGAIVRPR